jgi:glyoxylase-like metal-dependent hydrolase (beta-lactamase superfamily II)
VTDPAGVDIVTIVSEAFEENCYVLRRQSLAECIVVDPGLEPERILDLLARRRWVPAATLNTHGHADHIAGNAALKQAFPDSPLVIGRRDAPKLADPWQNLSAAFGGSITSPPADRLVDEGDLLDTAGFTWQVREIPGHSIGHVVFICRDTAPVLVLGGDVLMDGSIGRTDFPDGSFPPLAQGIFDKLFTLPDDTVVLPGHGPRTTIGREKRSNPFVGAPAGYRPAAPGG